MLDNKEKEETRKLILKLIKEGKITIPQAQSEEFFIQKSINSLIISKRIFELSENENIDGYMWVINTSYYSMFFAATTLLAHINKKIESEIGIHKLTYHALAYYFLIENNRLQKHFIEQYKNSYEDAEELLQLSNEKASDFVTNFSFEQAKRTKFTYETGRIAEKNKALTSITRAESFVTEARKMLND